MTLKEKFKDIVSDSITYKQQYDSFEQIADNYAIEFAKWCIANQSINELNKDSYKELLEIFKNEKGL